MRSRVLTPPESVFAIQTLREQVRIEAIGDSHPDDALLLRQAKAARAWAEKYTGRAIGEQTREAVADDFTELQYTGLPGGPASVVEAVEYRAAGTNVWTGLDPAAYFFDAYVNMILFVPYASLPATSLVERAIRVRYVVGAEPEPDVLAAVLLLVAELYANRETSAQMTLLDVPLSAKALLAPYRLEIGV